MPFICRLLVTRADSDILQNDGSAEKTYALGPLNFDIHTMSEGFTPYTATFTQRYRAPRKKTDVSIYSVSILRQR